jgi:hypothetical protein
MFSGLLKIKNNAYACNELQRALQGPGFTEAAT